MVRISFLGDISLNDEYSELYKKELKPFKKISGCLFNSDLVIGNLECFAESDKGENVLKKPRLKTNLETLSYLKDLNLKIATLANNHVYDNLKDGFNKTTNFLTEENIKWIGAGLSEEKAKEPLIEEINEIKFAFLNFVTKDTNPNLPDNAEIYLNWFYEDNITFDIIKLRNYVDYIIILLHWGGRFEGGNFPDWKQPQIAHRIIDAGADLLIGHHSHTLQPYEIYKGKYIFYSLGNFCFADINFDNKIREIKRGKETESIIVNVFFQKSKYHIKLLPIKNKEMQMIEDKEVLRRITKRNKIFYYLRNHKILWYLYYVKFKYIEPITFYLWGNDHKFFNQINEVDMGKIKRFFRGKV